MNKNTREFTMCKPTMSKISRDSNHRLDTHPAGQIEGILASESLQGTGSLVREPNETTTLSPTRRTNYFSEPALDRHYRSAEGDIMIKPPFRRKSRTRRSWFALRSFISMLAGVGCFLLFYLAFTALQGATYKDVQEIDAMIQSISYIKAEDKHRLHSIKAAIESGDAPAQRVLVVGMLESLSALQQNAPVIRSLASLCWVYEGAGRVYVQVIYKRSKIKEPLVSDNDRVEMLKTRLMQGGCSVTIEPEDFVLQNLNAGETEKEKTMEEIHHLSRYKRLAKLRSLHRSRILANPSRDFDVVVNVDLDVVEMPAIPAMVNSIERITHDSKSGAGNVVCANGFETWKVGRFRWLRRQMFYDTLAAVDAKGNWLYTDMSNSISGVIKFAQNTFLRDVLRRGQEMWPMQSCFGGVALYDFETWRNADCDYDAERIQYKPPQSETASVATSNLRAVNPEEEQNQREQWTLDPKFSLAGGETCEHVVFQQCLYDQSRSLGQRSLQIGIQPDLIIQREAAILGRIEDIVRLLDCLGNLVLYLTLVALVALRASRAISQFLCAEQQKHSIKRHIHEA